MPATLARTGVQVYFDATGKERREYRAPDAVFAADALATLGATPVTVGHQGRVDARNWRQLSVGHISDAPAQRRTDAGQDWIEADVVISDAETLRRVDANELIEVSMGYDADVVEIPGVSPSGERYDALQTNIRFNHIALLPEGRARAGAGARLRLDSKGDEEHMFRTDEALKRTIKLDGIDYEVGSDSHMQALEVRATRADAQVAVLNTELGTQRARADAAAARLAAAPSVEALVSDELAFRARLTPALPVGYAFAGRSRDQIVLDAVGAQVAAQVAALPEAQRAGYLTARLDDKLAAATRPTHTAAPRADGAPAKPIKFDPQASARKAYADSFGGTK